jgi:hypothetical protein
VYAKTYAKKKKQLKKSGKKQAPTWPEEGEGEGEGEGERETKEKEKKKMGGGRRK